MIFVFFLVLTFLTTLSKTR